MGNANFVVDIAYYRTRHYYDLCECADSEAVDGTRKISVSDHPTPDGNYRKGVRAAQLFRSRILWYGFIIAAAVNVWHGLAHFFPVLPDFSVRHNARNWGRVFTEKPWNAVGNIPVPLYPFVIGLGFLLPLDLSFSMWFFYLFEKGQRVFGSALAIPAPFPYGSEQSIGGWMAIFVIALLVTRSAHCKRRAHNLWDARCY